MFNLTHYPSTYWHSLPWHAVPWVCAPQWAQWAAMDRTGNWFWYEAEPKDEAGYFAASTGRVAQFTHLPYPAHWRMSLQHRQTETSIFFSSAEFAYAALRN